MHHGVRIQDPALVAAAVLSDRYVTGRFLPDKAIDLIDESASRLRIEIDSMPVEIDEVERRIRQLEIERAALQKETDPASAERLERIDRELADLQEQSTAMKAHWQQEKDLIGQIRQTKEEIETARMEAERAERDGDLERVAEIRYGRLVELEKSLEETNAALEELQREQKMLNEEVTEEDVAEVVAKWTGIPVSRLMEGEMQKLLRLEEHLHERVVGQDEAVEAVSNAIRRSRAGLSDPNRPDRLVPVPRADGRRQDRAGARARGVPVRRRARDGAHRHERVPGAARGLAPGRRAARLRRVRGGRAADGGGPSPPVQRDPAGRGREGAQRRLQHPAAAARRRPAHGRAGPHGRLPEHDRDHDVEPGLGRLPRSRRSPKDKVRESILEDVATFFRPEFVNRIDEIVVFEPLTKDDLRTIADIQVRQLARRLSERKLTLQLTDAAYELLSEEGYDPAFGARPLKRLLQRELENPLAMKLLAGEIHDGDTVLVDVEDGRLTIRAAQVAAGEGRGHWRHDRRTHPVRRGSCSSAASRT